MIDHGWKNLNRYWHRFDACPQCGVEAGDICIDQRFPRKIPWRRTLKPHAERPRIEKRNKMITETNVKIHTCDMTAAAVAERAAPTMTEENIVHIVCCNDDLALCGEDVSDAPFVDDDDNDCPLCVLADEAAGCAVCGGDS